MSEDRAGEGRVYSSTELKDNIGRTSFVRAAKDHVGTRSNPTEWAASRRFEQGRDVKPTSSDMSLVFDSNPSDVKALRAIGTPDEDIYEALKDR